MSHRILFVEDEAPFRNFAGRYLEDRGFKIDHAGNAQQAFAAYLANRPDLVLLDLNLPDLHGLEVLRQLRARNPGLRVVVLTAYGDAENAVSALKAGATDYLTKPVKLNHLAEAVQEALEATTSIPVPPRPPTTAHVHSGDMLGEHSSWLMVLDRLERVAKSELASVLLLGESGTGKSALARHFHTLGPGADRPFVEIDCPSIPEALLESELFGHEKGAFTGATTRKRGQVETAAGGTLLLDEIGELPPAIQPKLLRFLEQRRFRRVGGLEDLSTDVRLVCATNRDLRADVEAGAFRTDLFYRLEVVAIELPPLRERGDDVLIVARSLARRFGAEVGKPDLELSSGACDALLRHDFPGNVRELRNLIQRTVTFLESDRIEESDLDLANSQQVGRARPAASAQEGTPLPVELEQVLNAVEAHYVALAIERTGSQREAGALLGLDRFAVARRVNRMSRSGGVGESRQLLGSLPPWTAPVLADHPGALPEPGIQLPQLRAELEERAIAFAMRATEGNRARAATLLGMSRATLARRWKSSMK